MLLIDHAHRLMHLWRAGDEANVNDYIDDNGLARHALFARLLQALIELAPAGSEERAILRIAVQPYSRLRRHRGAPPGMPAHRVAHRVGRDYVDNGNESIALKADAMAQLTVRAVKWLVDEDHSDEAAGLLNDGSTFAAPVLVFAEAANALWAMRWRSDIAADDLADTVDALRTTPVPLPAAMPQLAPSAARLAGDLDHPVYDSFYFALTVQTQYPMVTADAHFHDKVRGHPYLSDRIVHVAHAASRGANAPPGKRP